MADHPQKIPSATNFFDQEGSAYFVELEEALMRGVGEEKPFHTNRPPTLEIFPSWPMRFQQEERREGSSGSGSSPQNTSSHLGSESPVSGKAEQEHKATARTETQEKRAVATGSPIGKKGKMLDPKTLRRLAQNREAARKSRLRKKAYIQQLESGRIRLQQLEHELHRARSQGLFVGGGAHPSGSLISSGAAAFDVEYAGWLESHHKRMGELRAGLQACLADDELRFIVDGCIASYDEIFRLKSTAAKTDAFHLLTGAWKTPAERCFLWIAGFRPSELLKMVLPAAEPLTEQQFMEICSLQQSSHQAEQALSQGLEQLYCSIAETLAGSSPAEGAVAVDCMSQMAAALGKLANLEGFVRQSDNLRQQTLHQLRRILTIRQAGRCFLVIGEYYNRLRALSSLWASRPQQQNLANDESACAATLGLHMLQHSFHSQYPAF
ncbi:TGACG-sequence-specific DNA-binding protein TGA-2.1 [Apostasia shenzhenica]|uniref:TGACG-sequence-specific DNA-binding protein TGA-2.1 n=1 Tax=Apostasia shenzhenica TaxID=1088818 RepID=A0A2I0BD73_9ASPA|nr:TGACG-sequence-specific DNA-binding protein TGA-2.1 [Apostasia shenzhenica]